MATSGVMAEFGRMPTERKVLVFAVIGLLLGLLYYQFVFKALGDDIAAAEGLNGVLAGKDRDLAAEVKAFPDMKLNVAKLQRIIEENQKALPTEAEVPAFFETLERKIAESGVEIIKWNKKPEEPVEQFVKVPVQIEITGTYMQIKRFFASLVQKDVAPVIPNADGSPAEQERERIVSIENLALTSPIVRNREIVLTADFTAVTFRQEDKAAPPPGAPAAPPAAAAPPKSTAPPMPSAATPAGAKARVEDSLKKGETIDRNATGVDEAKTPGGGSARLKGGN